MGEEEIPDIEDCQDYSSYQAGELSAAKARFWNACTEAVHAVMPHIVDVVRETSREFVEQGAEARQKRNRR